MSATQTYIMGKDAIYNLEMLDAIQRFGVAILRGRYLATWRILHVDGFEGTPRLPRRSGRQLQFFATLTSTCGGRVASTDPEPIGLVGERHDDMPNHSGADRE